VDAIARFDYPRELLDIQVLDDSTDETQEVARGCVERYQSARICRSTICIATTGSGFKAGALAAGLESATGEFVAIFDADFVPSPDFLRRTLPYLVDPRIAMVQARWTYLNRDYSTLTEIETILLDGHFVMEHGARSRSGTFFNLTARPACGAAARSTMPEAGSTIRSPKIPISLTARSFAAGSSSTCPISNAPPSCLWR